MHNWVTNQFLTYITPVRYLLIYQRELVPKIHYVDKNWAQSQLLPIWPLSASSLGVRRLYLIESVPRSTSRPLFYSLPRFLLAWLWPLHWLYEGFILIYFYLFGNIQLGIGYHGHQQVKHHKYYRVCSFDLQHSLGSHYENK